MFLVVSPLDLHYGFNRPFFARPKSPVPRKKFVHPLLLLSLLLLLLVVVVVLLLLLLLLLLFIIIHFLFSVDKLTHTYNTKYIN